MGSEMPQDKKLETNIGKLLTQIDTLIQGHETMKDQIKAKVEQGNVDEAKKLKKLCESKMQEIDNLFSMTNEYYSQRKEINNNISQDITKRIDDTKTNIDTMNAKYNDFKSGLAI